MRTPGERTSGAWTGGCVIHPDGGDETDRTAGNSYGCDGRCYWNTGMCPSVEICDETRVGEAIATAIGLITVLAMIAMVPIIVIGGAIMLIWSIFAV